MTIFSLVTAWVSPKTLEQIQGMRAEFFQSLQYHSGVTCIQTHDNMCMIHGEWETITRAFSILEEVDKSFQSRDTFMVGSRKPRDVAGTKNRSQEPPGGDLGKLSVSSQTEAAKHGDSEGEESDTKHRDAPRDSMNIQQTSNADCGDADSPYQNLAYPCRNQPYHGQGQSRNNSFGRKGIPETDSEHPCSYYIYTPASDKESRAKASLDNVLERYSVCKVKTDTARKPSVAELKEKIKSSENQNKETEQDSVGDGQFANSKASMQQEKCVATGTVYARSDDSAICGMKMEVESDNSDADESKDTVVDDDQVEIKEEPADEISDGEIDFDSDGNSSEGNHGDSPTGQLDFRNMIESAIENMEKVETDKANTKKSKKFKCTECEFVTRDRSCLRNHCKRCHMERNFQCKICGRKYGLATDLRKHEKRSHTEKHVCSVCGKTYKALRNLKEHLKKHEEDYVPPCFKCGECEKAFQHRHTLLMHVDSEHRGNKKSFLCTTCGKSFTQKGSLVEHERLHLGIKPFSCPVCDKAFTYSSALKKHMAVHSDVKHFFCDVCNKGFKTTECLRLHKNIHAETPQFICTTCGKGFRQKAALVRHNRIHNGERPYECKICGSRFNDNSILRRHMFVHNKANLEKKKTNKRRLDDDVADGVGKDKVLRTAVAEQAIQSAVAQYIPKELEGNQNSDGSHTGNQYSRSSLAELSPSHPGPVSLYAGQGTPYYDQGLASALCSHYGPSTL